MSAKFKNRSAGKNCDGVCDKCNNYSEFLFWNIATFCEKCVNRMSGLQSMRVSKKLILPVDNSLRLDYCTMCNARPTKLLRVNFGICRSCLKKFGDKHKRTAKDEIEKTKDIMNNYRRKVGLKTLTDEEARKRLQDMKKNKR